MKRQFAVILLLISILSLSGCHKEPSTPKARVPSIMYNGEIYCTTGKQMPGEVAEDAIIGEITSTVSLSQWPEEDGQANFDILGALLMQPPPMDLLFSSITNGRFLRKEKSANSF